MCSPINVPVIFVLIGLNSPRTLAGAGVLAGHAGRLCLIAPQEEVRQA